MSTSKKEKHLRNLISFSFLISIIIGFSSELIPEGGIKHLLWALAAFFMIIAASLLASMLSRQEHDIPAAGFAVIVVAQAMAYGFLATHDAGDEQLGAIVAIFVPGLVLISFYDLAPLLIRVLGFVGAASFTALALMIYTGADITTTKQILISIGYGGMNLALLGWAWLVYRKKL